MSLLDRIAARTVDRPTERRSSIDQWIADYLIPAQFGFNGVQYSAGIPGLTQTLAGNRATEVLTTLPGYLAALRSCPPAFAAQLVRALVLSQARFVFRNPPWHPTSPRKTFGTRALGLLERPWRNATTGELIARMEWHAGVAGNAYVTRRPDRLRVLRPDWVAILYGSHLEPEDPGHALDGELIGYVYQNQGLFTGKYRPQTLLPQDTAHWSPVPDPENAGIGMSWITPAVREIQQDRLATTHTIRYFEQGASPNLVVKGINAATREQFEEIVDMMEAKHAGVANAYRCLHPETEVAMWDGSRRRADAVSVGDTVVAWAGSCAVPGRVTAADWQPSAPIVTVTTQRGRVIRTNDRHPFLLKDGSWVQAIDLNYGDLLVTGLGWASDNDAADTLTPYQAWVLGVIVGDGCTIADSPVISAWDEGIRTRLRVGHPLRHTGKGHDYRVLGARRMCTEAGVMYKRSYEKRIPPQVLAGSAKVKWAFLAGLIDTDGHVSDPALRRSCEVGITSTCKELLTDAQHVLASLGVNASVSLSMPAGGAGGGAHGEGPRGRDVWRLVALGNDQARRLWPTLDLACTEKARRLAEYATIPSRQDRSRYDRVVSVVVGAPEPTIGLEIADHHTHVTGGVVTHNTLYLTAGADVTPVGANLGELDLKGVHGSTETRIASLSRVHPVILGIAEGLAGSSLNAGNFGMARRIWADSWIYPTLQDLAASLAPLIDVPADAELWTDTGDMPILREDAKDAAEIEQVKAATISSLITNGFTRKSVIAAVTGQNMTLLEEDPQWISVQLQAASGQPPPALPAGGAGPKAPPAVRATERKFNPAEPRDPHGKWSRVGARIAHEVHQLAVGELHMHADQDKPGHVTLTHGDRSITLNEGEQHAFTRALTRSSEPAVYGNRITGTSGGGDSPRPHFSLLYKVTHGGEDEDGAAHAHTLTIAEPDDSRETLDARPSLAMTNKHVGDIDQGTGRIAQARRIDTGYGPLDMFATQDDHIGLRMKDEHGDPTEVTFDKKDWLKLAHAVDLLNEGFDEKNPDEDAPEINHVTVKTSAGPVEMRWRGSRDTGRQFPHWYDPGSSLSITPAYSAPWSVVVGGDHMSEFFDRLSRLESATGIDTMSFLPSQAAQKKWLTVHADGSSRSASRSDERKFNPAEPRVPGGEHGGEWTSGGVIRDALKLAGKIELADGEKLLGSSKVDGDQGTVRLALVGHGGHRSLRLGIGGPGFGARDDDAGPWRGGPDRTAEINAEQKRLRDEQDAIGKELDRLDVDPTADPERKAALRRRFDEIEDMGTGDVYASGYTAVLDSAAAANLRTQLTAALDGAAKTEKTVDAHFDEIDRLKARYNALYKNAPSTAWETNEGAAAIHAQADAIRRQIAVLEAEPPTGSSGTRGDYFSVEGSIPGEWADVHYAVYLDDPDIGVEVMLGAVPRGAGRDLSDLSGDGQVATLDPAEARRFLRLLDQYAGPDKPARSVRTAGHDTTPGHDELHHYWTKGAGLGRWAGSSTPWATLLANLVEEVKDKPLPVLKKWASRWFIEVFGFAAGSDLNRVAHGKPPRGHKVGPG